MENNQILTPENINFMIDEMISNPKKLSQGHILITKYEIIKGFYISLLQIALNENTQKSKIKLSASILMNYLRKNWSDDNFICLEEKMEIFSILTLNLHHKDYFLKNFVAKLLGMISAKEWPSSYEVIIKKILRGIIESKSDIVTDNYLTILLNIIQECDDRIAQMTSELMPIVIDVFKNSTVSILFLI